MNNLFELEATGSGGTWSALTPAVSGSPTARSSLGFTSANNTLFVFGGVDGSGESAQVALR